ncbi:hypothetical protein V7x_22760 [Crateriforma conspicua]|uniref:DUF1559 domain-containing protein n=1 Tax=Crateriforma conspicua TaxID=2527996 RepID=A0A5C6FYL2_9PLAN|nr:MULTISPECIES: DUF1559 domain-containing protein [Crateriforma]TWU66705.1 hypothetical protein V7x_22760 [Crateriforma conspicua]
MKGLPKRLGVTLIELLVVFSVIALLAGISLPAIQSARERARINTCQNRLRQLVLASHHHHNAFKHLPTGGWGYRWVGIAGRGVGENQPGGWIFNCLPFLEQQALFDRIRPTDDGLIPAQPLQVELPLVRCPSRPGPAVVKCAKKPMPVNSHPLGDVARTDYAACEGDIITDSKAGPDDLSPSAIQRYRWADTSAANGVCFQRSMVRFRDIRDGQSQTYFCGEKYVRQSEYFSSDDLGYDQSALSGIDVDLVRWTHLLPKRDSGASEIRRFGSVHAAGFSMAFCDASVKFLSYSIDPAIHRSQGTRYTVGSRTR